MPNPLCAISTRLGSLYRAVPLSLVLLVGAAGASRADDASPWDADQRSALRLIAGSASMGATVLRAGIAMRVAPGWKTYWRYAGDSGLPPSFDFAGSENVKSVAVLWPAPRRFADGAGGNSIGYTGEVVFPLQVMPQDARRPVTLRLRADYGVCEKVCIPASGKAQLELTGGPSSEDTALSEAELRVPKAAALGEPGPLSVRALHREAKSSRQRVIIDVTAPERAEVDLFAEGPTPQWSLPLPQPVESGPDGARRFAFEVEGVPPGSSIAGAQIKLTLVAGNDAIEVTTHLD
jgi:DsbC/DsbD-like thiol-disulfide interchange protein